jgi:purine-binding chemotaxis protein CheW
MPNPEKAAFTEKQIVVFRISTEEFGVDINEVREIIKLEDVTRIPNAESYVEGVINLRGKIIVIIDLAKKLGLAEKSASKDTRIIVIEVNSSTLGMVVDSCNEVMRLQGEQVESAPEIIKRKIKEDFIEGVAVLKERLIILLDLAKILGKEELDKVAEIQA